MAMTRTRSRLTAATLALFCAAPLYAQTAAEEEDKDFLTRLLQDSLSGAGRGVEIDGFQGALSSRASIERLTIADDEGVWLTITDVVLDWNRSALLRARLEVNEFSAGTIDMPRLPQTAPEAPDPEAATEPFTLPELPVSIRIDRLDADLITLGRPVLGQAAGFALSGSARYDETTAEATLDLIRTDDVRGGSITLDTRYSPSDSNLMIDLEVTEEAGGIAASALNLPGTPSVALTLAGEGPITNFDADIALTTDEVPRVTGRVGLTEDQGRSGFTFDLAGDLAELLPPEQRPYFEGGTARMAATGFRDPDGSMELQNLTIAAPSLDLAGSMALGPDNWPTRLSLKGELASEDARTEVPFAPEVTVGRATLELTYDSSEDNRFDGVFAIYEPQAPGYAADLLSLTADGTLSPGEGDVPGQFGASIALEALGLAPEDPALAEALGTEVAAGLRIDLAEQGPVAISGLNLRAAGMALDGDITVDRAEGANLLTSLTVQLVADDLARFSALSGMDLSGGADLALSGDVVPLTGAFNLDAKGTTTDLKTGIAELDGLLTGTGEIDLRAVRDTDGLRLERARVETEALQARGTADITSQGTVAEFDARLTSIAAALPGSDGSAEASGTASISPEGVPSALEANITLRAGDSGQVVIAAGDTPLIADGGRLDITLDPTQRVVYAADFTGARYGEFGAQSLRARGNTRIDETPLATRVDVIAQGLSDRLADLIGPEAEVGATLTFAPDGLIVSDGTIAAQSLSGTAGARLPSDGPISFRAALDSPALARIPALADTGVGGAASVMILGNVEDGATRLRVDGTGRDLALASVTPGPLLPGKAQFGTDVTIDGGGVTLSDATVTHPQISAEAEVRLPSEGPITFAADVSTGSLGALAPLAATGIAGATDARIEGQVSDGVTRLEIDGAATNLSVGPAISARLLSGTARYSTALVIGPDGLSIDRAQITHPNLTASASGTPDLIAFDARLADLALLAPDFPGPVSASGTVRQTGSGTVLNVDASGPGGSRVALSGTPGQRLGASGTAPLGLLNPFLAPRLIAGQATFDLQVNGAVAPANLSGSVSTRGARLTAPELGQSLTGIDADIALSGGQARIELQGALTTGGTVNITGPVRLSSPYVADLAIALRGLTIRDEGLYEADLGGALTLRGPLAGGASITGRVDVDRAEIQVPSTGMTALGDVPPIRHIGASPANAATRARAGIELSDGRVTASDGSGGGSGGFPVALRIVAPSRIFVRGRGLDAELGGELRLSGTTNDVIPGGRFDLIRGRLDILGQRFDLTEGSAQLVGDFDPYLRLVATTVKDDTEVSVVIEGPASAPEIRFESSPDLPQEEVLALLLFSKSITSLSPFQAVQLASAVATLAGRGGGVIGQLRENFALDDLDVTTDENGETAVRAGKYISENVYTDVTIGADGTSEINLNLDVSRNVTVKAGQSSDGNSSLGIFFEKDY